jgi:hypothetical protein
LRVAGIDGLVETASDGAFRLAPLHRSVIGGSNDLALDGYLRISKEQAFAASQS